MLYVLYHICILFWNILETIHIIYMCVRHVFRIVAILHIYFRYKPSLTDDGQHQTCYLGSTRFGGESEQLDMLHRGSTDGHYPRLPEALQQLQVVSLGSLDLTRLEV